MQIAPDSKYLMPNGFSDRKPYILKRNSKPNCLKSWRQALSLRRQGRLNEAALVLDAFTAACFNRVSKKMDALRQRFTADASDLLE